MTRTLLGSGHNSSDIDADRYGDVRAAVGTAVGFVDERTAVGVTNVDASGVDVRDSAPGDAEITGDEEGT